VTDEELANVLEYQLNVITARAPQGKHHVLLAYIYPIFYLAMLAGAPPWFINSMEAMNTRLDDLKAAVDDMRSCLSEIHEMAAIVRFSFDPEHNFAHCILVIQPRLLEWGSSSF